jgi:hypothetical protein
MHPSAMKKHRREGCLEAERRGHQAVLAYEDGELPIAQRQLEQKCQRVQGDERDDECREGPGRDDVPKRDHDGLSV